MPLPYVTAKATGKAKSPGGRTKSNGAMTKKTNSRKKGSKK